MVTITVAKFNSFPGTEDTQRCYTVYIAPALLSINLYNVCNGNDATNN